MNRISKRWAGFGIAVLLGITGVGGLSAATADDDLGQGQGQGQGQGEAQGQ